MRVAWLQGPCEFAWNHTYPQTYSCRSTQNSWIDVSSKYIEEKNKAM